MTVLVGGVGELYQGDLDLGRRVVARLAPAPPGVLVEDLHYGAVAVAQRLGELSPEALLLAGAARRGRPAGSVHRRRVTPPVGDPATLQTAVTHAVVGYVDLDLVVQVAAGFGVLPARTVVLEAEPAWVGPGEQLSPAGAAALDRLVDLARTELARLPLLALADQLRARLAAGQPGPGPAVAAVTEVLDALDVLDHTGRWAGAFAARDRLRWAIARGQTSEGMDHLDWGLWWALVEELDRHERAEAVAATAP